MAIGMVPMAANSKQLRKATGRLRLLE